MDGAGDYHVKCNKTEKDKYVMVLFICRILKKMIQNLQKRNRLTDLENKVTISKCSRGGGDKLGVCHIHIAVFKIDNQQGLTV